MAPGRLATSDAQLLLASAAASLAGAVFVILVERHLGADGFEPVAQLWNLWAISAAYLTISLQLGTIGADGALTSVLNRVMLLAVVVLAVGFGLLATVFADRLFGERTLGWTFLSAAIPLGAASMGVTRGYWARRRQFGRTAAVIGSENLIRLAIAAVLVSAGAGAGWFGLAILVGFLPVAFTPWGDVGPAADRADINATNTVTTGAAIATLCSFGTFSAAPIVLAIAGATDTITSAAFLALVLARIPQGLAQGVIPRLSVAANHVRDSDQAHRLVDWQRQIGAAVVVAGPVIAVVAAFVLGPVAALLFGDEVELSRTAYGLAAFAAIVNLALVGQVILLAAARRARLLAGAWAVALPIVAVAVAVSPLDTPEAVFLTAGVVELAVLLAYVLAPAPDSR